MKPAPYSPRIWAPLFHPTSHRSALALLPELGVSALWSMNTAWGDTGIGGVAWGEGYILRGELAPTP